MAPTHTPGTRSCAPASCTYARWSGSRGEVGWYDEPFAADLLARDVARLGVLHVVVERPLVVHDLRPLAIGVGDGGQASGHPLSACRRGRPGREQQRRPHRQTTALARDLAALVGREVVER